MTVPEWRQRMHPKNSRMELEIQTHLSIAGIGHYTDHDFCLQHTIPDVWIPDYHNGDKHGLAVYLDGPVHKGKRLDKDDLLREKLTKYHKVKVLSIPYKGVSMKEQLRVFGLIKEALDAE